ncbi:MAG: DUF1616 domain-containing protein [Halosimplex sp.]
MAFAVGAAIVFSLPLLGGSPVRVLVGLPVLVFLPGYVIVAVLFPRDGPQTGKADREHLRIGLGRRIALSFGASLAAVPPLALVWWNVGPGRSSNPFALVGFVCLGAILGSLRRSAVPADERFRLPIRRWATRLRSALFSGPGPHRVANAVLMVTVLAASVSMAYALAVPNDAGASSGLFLATENETGALVTSGFPTDFEPNQSKELTVGVRNREGERTAYTVIVELQRVATDGRTVSVREKRQLHRFGFELDSGECWHRQHSLRPQMTGENLRVQYYLFVDDPPDDPTVNAAYRTTHLWINVTEGE